MTTLELVTSGRSVSIGELVCVHFSAAVAGVPETASTKTGASAALNTISIAAPRQSERARSQRRSMQPQCPNINQCESGRTISGSMLQLKGEQASGGHPPRVLLVGYCGRQHPSPTP